MLRREWIVVLSQILPGFDSWSRIWLGLFHLIFENGKSSLYIPFLVHLGKNGTRPAAAYPIRHSQ